MSYKENYFLLIRNNKVFVNALVFLAGYLYILNVLSRNFLDVLIIAFTMFVFWIFNYNLLIVVLKEEVERLEKEEVERLELSNECKR